MSDGQNIDDVDGTATRIAANIMYQVEQVQGQAITPFFFSIGEFANEYGDSLMKSAACRANGIWGRINSTENPLRSLYPFFNFLARTSSIYNHGSYYSDVYTDALGMGRVFTISQAGMWSC
jgi:hypothetical protein